MLTPEGGDGTVEECVSVSVLHNIWHASISLTILMNYDEEICSYKEFPCIIVARCMCILPTLRVFNKEKLNWEKHLEKILKRLFLGVLSYYTLMVVSAPFLHTSYTIDSQ